MSLLRTSAVALPLILMVPARAQSPIVSPAGYALVEGNAANSYPLNTIDVRRYQQIHSDIGGQPRLITKLGFRGDAGSTTTFTGTRALDLEMLMGDGVDWNHAVFTFAQNYTGTPVPVFARRVLSIGPLGQSQTPGPNPFTIDIPLDSPHTYAGVQSLVWEMRLHANVLTGAFNLIDAVNHGGRFSGGGITGFGCRASGRTGFMLHKSDAQDRGGMLMYTTSLTEGPASAATFLTIGTTNPNLAVPGLCGNLFTDLLVTVPMGTTDAAGAIPGHASFNLLFLTNVLAGARLFTQAVSLDVGRSDPIGLALSDGRLTVFPTPFTGTLVRAARLYNDTGGGTTATQASFSTSTHGYALVTQFTF